MYLIAGLGNPGGRFDRTYHNLGFMVMDKLADKLGAEFRKTRNNAKIADAVINGKKVILAKPQTYMNLSGQSIVAFVRKQKLEPKNVIVICDDIDIKKGDIRYRECGSGGTHNGLRNIVEFIGQDFKRIRVGAGEEDYEKFGGLREYVTSHIDKQSMETLLPAIDKAIEKIISLFD